MNVCCFTGTLGKDWEVQYSSAGKPRAKNSMAIRKYNGETLWINLVMFSEKRIQALTNNTGKGDKLSVSTNLDINEHEGKYYHTFIINDFTFCGSRSDNQQSNQGGDQAPQQQQNQGFQQQAFQSQQGQGFHNQGNQGFNQPPEDD